MKTTDWYLRLVLGVIAGSLVYLAVTLRTATQEAAAFYARVPVATAAEPVAMPTAWAVSQRMPSSTAPTSPTAPTAPMRVYVAGYIWNNEPKEFGDSYSYMVRGLPIVDRSK